jgi:methionine-rich copper-binding protein CopC
MKKSLGIAALIVVLLAFPHNASAHAIALACLPRMGINVSKVPTQIICQFSEPLLPSNISMIVTNANGERVDNNDTQFYENDTYTLVVSLDTNKITQGIYTVTWRVTDTVDAGETTSTWQFGVNTVVPPTPTAVLPGIPITPTTPVEPTTSPATELIARFLIGIGVVIFAALGVVFWRMRSRQSAISSEQTD